MVDKERSREIRCHIRAVLMAEWDPIGVSDIPEAADEYDSYIGGVYELWNAEHLRPVSAITCATSKLIGWIWLMCDSQDLTLQNVMSDGVATVRTDP